jgi:uncharacterized membrane protein
LKKEFKMPELIVLTFDDAEQAGEVLKALKGLQHEGEVKIDDAAVIVKHESGKVEVKKRLDTGVRRGAIGGGLLGLLLAGLFFPVAGVLIGVVGGALIGKKLNYGVEDKFVRSVTESLEPGMSALFVMGSGNPTALRAALTPFKGTVYQTTLSEETVETLTEALK